MSKKDEYGFQRAFDFNPEEGKNALQRVIALSQVERAERTVIEETKAERLARLKAKVDEGRAAYARREEDIRESIRQRELSAPPVDAESPVVVEATPAEPAPDYSDTVKWVEVRVPELTGYRDNGDAETGRVWVVTTGRYVTSWRLRTPDDGDAPVIDEAPQVPAPKPPEMMQRHVWFSDDNRRGPYATVEQNRARHAREDAERPKGSFTRGSLLR